MKTKKAIFFLFIFLSYIPVLAQVDTAWVRCYNGQGIDDFTTSLAVDDSDNVYVTGFSGDYPTNDYSTVKYSSRGDLLWSRNYNGPANSWDVAVALAVDNNQSLYVTGYSIGSGSSDDYATIKYSTSGDTLWVRRYNGPENKVDVVRDLFVDDTGNVYVTGCSNCFSDFGDYTTIKYSTNGDTLWVRHYNGPGDGADEALALAADRNGNLYVTGFSWGVGTNFDYATIKYAANGDIRWVRRYNGLTNYFDQPLDLALDSNGNVFVTGFSDGDYTTIKYSPEGYTLWVRRYNGPGNGGDEARALAVDGNGNVIVTGRSGGRGTSMDYATIKYNPKGKKLWVRRYNGPGNDDDIALALALDNSDNVYVTGQSIGNGTYFDYATIKYSSKGDVLWVQRYNLVGYRVDVARALAVNKNGNVYVTGNSTCSATSFDYTTIKYVQYICLAKPGDANNDNQILLSDIVTLINFLFKSQPAPNPSCRADANADGNILLSDIVYLINFLFKSGPEPQKSRECCL